MTTEIYLHNDDRFPYRPTPLIWLITYLSISLIFFTSLHRWISFPSTWFHKNTCISFIHSALSSILLIISVSRAPEVFDDPVSYNNRFNSLLIAFSLGYFIYDFSDNVLHAKAWFSAILLHHLIAIIFLAEILISGRNGGYALYGLSLEMNSVFLHARRLVQWYYPSAKQLKRLVDLFNIITFVVFRFAVVSLGYRALVIEQSRMNPLVHRLTSIFALVITVMNLVLFYRLLKTQSDDGRKHE